MPYPIIFDTDPGADDAQAITIALRHPDMELLGLTTTYGNVDVETATHKALLLVQLAGREDVAVAHGAAGPLIKPRHPAPSHIHGKNGLGDIAFHTLKSQPDPRSAAQLIVATVTVRPSEITLVTVDTVATLAAALQLDPALVDK